MIFISIMAFIMAIIIIVQAYKKRQLHKEIRYIAEKLDSIIEKNTQEQLMLFTDNNYLKLLLVEINQLLGHNQIIVAKYAKSQLSMKRSLSNISHDLKTPLTVVLGYIENIISDKSLAEEERLWRLSRAHDKIKEVLELMNKFFSLAKLESGDSNIEVSRINMNEALRKNILSFYDILSAKGIAAKIEIPREDIFAFANENAFERIINNLITNAVNYGAEGKILGIGLRYDDESVFIDVWDKGKGILEVHQDMVFERLYTLEDSRNKNYQGSGLGLTITKRLVEKMGGEISLVSKPYEKTVFTVKLKRITY